MNRGKIDAMHRLYGIDGMNRKCGECVHLVKHKRDRTYYKCSLYGMSSSVATDWRVRWPACKLIDHDPEPDNFQPVMERLHTVPGYTGRRRPAEQIEGQTEMEI